MRAAAIAALFIPMTFLFAGCGGSVEVSKEALREAQDRQQIEATAIGFAAAVKAKDPKAFCKLLSPEDKKHLRYERRRCLVVWGPKQNLLFRAKSPDLEVVEIAKVDPPNATTKLANGGRLVFLQEDGTWYVNLAPAKE